MLLPLLVAFVWQHPCPQLPLVANASWTYRAEVAWTPTGTSDVRRRIITWTTTVLTVQGSGNTIAATVRGWLSDLAWWEPGHTPATFVLACQDGRVYLFRPAVGGAPALADALVSGARSLTPEDLILQFPLRTGALFGRDAADRPDTFYAWYVESAVPMSRDVRRFQPGLTDSVYSVIYRTMPDHERVHFAPGLGVTAYQYSHHGTVAEADAVLIGYVRGKP